MPHTAIRINMKNIILLIIISLLWECDKSGLENMKWEYDTNPGILIIDDTLHRFPQNDSLLKT